MPRFTKTAILLHWLVAALIVSAFALGTIMVDIPGLTPTKLKYFSWHKWIGVTVLALVALRLLWRLTHAAPAYPATMPAWQKGAAHALHGLLYAADVRDPGLRLLLQPGGRRAGRLSRRAALPVLIAPDPEWKAVLKQVHYALNMTLLAAFVAACGGGAQAPIHRQGRRAQAHAALIPLVFT